MNKKKKPSSRPPIEYREIYQRSSIDDIREALDRIEDRRRDENLLLLGILWQLQRINDTIRKRK